MVNLKSIKTANDNLALFPFPSHDHQYYGVTSGFTRLNMKTECVRHIPISPHFKFHNDRTMGTVTSLVKNWRWGEGKRADNLLL